ncbi:MAG TPA: hypothetical protein PKL83_07210 [bacterium]|nr:hypothetical protein [bacterium]
MTKQKFLDARTILDMIPVGNSETRQQLLEMLLGMNRYDISAALQGYQAVDAAARGSSGISEADLQLIAAGYTVSDDAENILAALGRKLIRVYQYAQERKQE